MLKVVMVLIDWERVLSEQATITTFRRLRGSPWARTQQPLASCPDAPACARQVATPRHGGGWVWDKDLGASSVDVAQVPGVYGRGVSPQVSHKDTLNKTPRIHAHVHNSAECVLMHGKSSDPCHQGHGQCAP